MNNTIQLFIVLFFGIHISGLNAQKQEYILEENISYYDGSIDTYQKERCKIDIYYPKNSENFPTVVWMHGDTDQIVSMTQAEELCNVIETANCPILKLRHHKGHMVDLKQKNEIIQWIDSIAK